MNSLGLSAGSIGLAAGVVVLIALIVLIATVKSLIIIVPPNLAAVLTGRRRKLMDGRGVGYRAVIGGRTMRIPIIETVDYVSLETIPLEITVTNAFSKGNIPLTVQAIANVKIASEPETDFNNAVERLLNKTPAEIRGLAQETLMGNLRGVLATLTPEEVNEDRLKFAEKLLEEAENDLKKLGFTLDVLKIQNVSDEVGYLDAMGRKKTAQVKKEAEVAEAENESETRRAKAAADQSAAIAEAEANIQISEAQNKLKVRQAQLRQAAETADKVARVEAERAEVEAQKEMQVRRAETERERLNADVVAPAEADRLAAEARAKAAAAPIIESGRAQVQVLKLLLDQIAAGGTQGFPVFMAEKLPQLMTLATDAVKGIEVDRMVVLDSGQGQGLGNVANQRVSASLAMIEQLAAALGIDVSQLIQGAARRVGGGDGAETAAGGPTMQG